MTADATHFPGDVQLSRQYLKLPARLSTPEHEAIAFLIWLDLQRQGRAVAPAVEALGLTVDEWRSIARAVGRQLGQTIRTATDKATSETVATVEGWPLTDRDRAIQHVLSATAGSAANRINFGVKRPVGYQSRAVRDTRQTLVDTAERLYVEFGLDAVGIDLLIAEAQVAKSSLYKHFKSNDILTATVLRRRHDIAVDDLARIEARELAATDTLREFVTGLASPPGADLLLHALTLFRSDEHPARAVAITHRQWRLAELHRLLAAAGAAHPDDEAAELSAALDGASLMAQSGQGERATHAIARAWGVSP